MATFFSVVDRLRVGRWAYQVFASALDAASGSRSRSRRWLLLPAAAVLLGALASARPATASVTCVEQLFGDEERQLYENHTQFRYYHCPGRFPADHTRCCHLDQQLCCPGRRRFYEIDPTWAIVISVTVSLLCLLVGITCIVCCFWNRCPLWPCCRPQPKHDVAFADQYEKIPVLPPEERGACEGVKVKQANGQSQARAPLASLASTNASQDNLDA